MAQLVMDQPVTRHAASASRLTRRRLLAACGAASLLAVSGCGSAEPTYYTLPSWPGASLLGPAVSVEVRTPNVAPYLDRDTIVREDANDRLTLAEDASWASPLDELIGRALGADLAQRLPGSSVYTQASGLEGRPDTIVELDVTRLLRDAQGQAVLEATLSVHHAGGALGALPVRYARAPADGSIGALVSAMGALLGALADQVAAEVRRLGPQP